MTPAPPDRNFERDTKISPFFLLLGFRVLEAKILFLNFPLKEEGMKTYQLLDARLFLSFRKRARDRERERERERE